jgi:hypothetical protein
MTLLYVVLCLAVVAGFAYLERRDRREWARIDREAARLRGELRRERAA